MNVAGIDVGTSSVKCAVYNENGRIISYAVKNYSYAENIDGYCLDAETVWTGTREVLSKAARQCGGEIEGLAVSSIGEGCILLDSNNSPIAPSILYNDKRGQKEGIDFNRYFNAAAVFDRTGVYANGTYSLSKLKWIADNAEYFHKAKKILLFEDLITYYLTGERVISYSLAARTMGFDIRKKTWIKEFFDYSGIDCAMMSAPAISGTYVGKIRRHLAEELQLNPELKVYTGGHDQLCCVLGGGLVHKDIAVNVSGSGDTISFLLDSPLVDLELGEKGYCNCPTESKNRYLTYGLCAMSGTMLTWFRNKIWKEDVSHFYADMEHLLKDVKTEVQVFPGFSALGTPHFSLNTTGMINGITLSTEPEEIYLAMLLSIAYSLKKDMQELQDLTHPCKLIRVAGGGGLSCLWNQLKADVWGKTIEVVENRQAGTAGCGMLAAKGLGLYSSMDEAAKCFVHIQDRFRPDPEKRCYYDEQFEKYNELYSAKMELSEMKY